MKTSFISTTTLWNAPRAGLNKMQADLAKATKEMTSGRDTDVGLRLGFRAGEAFSLRQEMEHLDSIIDSNATVKVRLEASTAALARARMSSEKFAATLIASPVGDRNLPVVLLEAKSTLAGLVGDLNRAVNGQYIFGGINSGERPIVEDGSMPPAAAKSAIDAAFSAFFGFPQSSPSVASINEAQMNAFLDGPYKALFDNGPWAATWSNASNQSITSQISTSEVIETSVSANESAVRQLAMGYSMILELGISNLGADVRETLLARAIKTIGEGGSAMSDLEAQIGMSQEKIEHANSRMDIQKDVFNEKLFGLEGVDPLEAKTRIDHLTTQIQTSFSLTAQLRNLSLINFI